MLRPFITNEEKGPEENMKIRSFTLVVSKNSSFDFGSKGQLPVRGHTLITLPQKGKVEIFLEQREVAFLSPSKICENLNFSTEIQIFANFAG